MALTITHRMPLKAWAEEGRVVRAFAILALIFGSLATGIMVSHASPIPVLAIGTGAFLVIVAIRAPRPVIWITLCALPFIGLIRRATGSYLSPSDPLLFVSPVVAAACICHASPGRRFVPTAMCNTVLAIFALGALEALNPAQGGLKVGILGAGLFVGQMVWFFVGQRFGTAAFMRRIATTLAVIAVVAAIYGTKQLLFGFFGFEQRWIANRVSSYAALTIQGQTRPFSTFASAAEYSYFMVLGSVLFAMRVRRGRRLVFGSIVVLFAVVAFYAGSRGIFITCCSAALLIVLVRRSRRLGRSLAMCVALSLLGLTLLRFVPLSTDTSVSAATRNRTVTGLTRPFDPQVSTLGVHLTSFSRGVLTGIRNPLGIGAGVTNRASSLYGDTTVSSEHDLPNIMIAYGWAGAVLLALLLCNVYRAARQAGASGDLALIGPSIFVLVLFGTWFVGGLYSISAIIWFFAGAVDGQLADIAEARSRPDERQAGLAEVASSQKPRLRT